MWATEIFRARLGITGPGNPDYGPLHEKMCGHYEVQHHDLLRERAWFRAIMTVFIAQWREP